MASSGDRQIAADAEGDSVCCSFCKKEPATGGALIKGPDPPGGTPPYICQECVEICSSILQQRKMFGGAGQHAPNQSNPLSASEKIQVKQAAVEPSFEDTCNAAADILRRLMGHGQALLEEKTDQSLSILTSLEEPIRER